MFPDELPGFQVPEPLRPSQEDFASRLDLDDEPDEDERRNFPTANPRPRTRPPSAAGFHDPPSESYTFAEPFPTSSNLSFAPHSTGEDFDEPHGFTQNTPAPARPRSPSQDFEQSARARRPSYVPPEIQGADDDAISRALSSFDETSQPKAQPIAPAEPQSEDLEDALAALDVDLDPEVQQQRRAKRKSAQHRPLPGLPLERPQTGPVPVAAEPKRRPTPSPHVVQRNPSPTGSNASARQTGKAPTVPPPIPAAARKPPTMPPPTPTRVPSQRPSTDDGILIDFDEDE